MLPYYISYQANFKSKIQRGCGAESARQLRCNLADAGILTSHRKSSGSLRLLQAFLIMRPASQTMKRLGRRASCGQTATQRMQEMHCD